MKIKKLVKDLNLEVKGSREVEITGISAQSQFIAPGNLFIARKGKVFDGTTFIPDAVERGAAAVLTDFYNPFTPEIVQLITHDVAQIEGALAERYYETNKNPLCTIGITGTNGKTTTAYLLHHLLPHFGLMGTIETIIGDQNIPAQLTTADVVTNHKTLREMRDKGLQGAIMEVTSHALDQNRVENIFFDLAIFTNLSQDHLDYHGTMDHYFGAKKKLFSRAKKTIYNIDDPRGKTFRGDLSFGIDAGGDLQAQNIQTTLEKTTFDLAYRGETFPIQVPLLGKYNVYNVLAALGAALHKGEELPLMRERLTTFPGIPGRLERIVNPLGIHLFVDFAHTPAALECLLQTLQSVKTGKITTIFGCGGDRDKEKRPKMGAVAEQYSDRVIITSDNPRFEEPAAICRAIAAGLSNKGIIELDRRAAMEKGITEAAKNDIVVIAGRGHESVQNIQGRLIPFDDRKVAKHISHLTSEQQSG